MVLLMGKIKSIEIVRNVPLELIEAEIDKLDGTVRTKSDIVVKKRLELIRYRYKGLSMIVATDLLRINIQTGYNWQSVWNQFGMDGLISLPLSGRPSLLDSNQMSQVVEVVKKDHMSTDQIVSYIKEEYGVDYTPTQIKNKMFKMGLKYTVSEISFDNSMKKSGYWS